MIGVSDTVGVCTHIHTAHTRFTSKGAGRGHAACNRPHNVGGACGGCGSPRDWDLHLGRRELLDEVGALAGFHAVAPARLAPRLRGGE